MKEEGKKLDRRVKYTVTALKNALVDALGKEHISKISVKALCEAADVNRSTFYAHFKDQYDLLEQMEREVLDKIVRHLEGQEVRGNQPISSQVLCRILEYAKKNADLFRALLSDNCEPGIQREVMNLAQIFPVMPYGNGDEHIKEYLVVFGTTGCMSILQKWLHDNTPEPVEKIAALILQILYHGTISFYGGKGVG